MPKIVLYPNKILRKKSKKIVSLDGKTKKEIEGLVSSLLARQDGAALAANQIGVAKRFLGIKNRQTKKVKVYINPKIVKTYGNKQFFEMKTDEGMEDFLEGCLSFPQLFGMVKRFSKLDIVWQEVKDNKLINKSAKLNGFEAIVIQHEMDHLDGVLFIDRVKEDGGKFYKMIGDELIDQDVDDVIDSEKIS